MVEEIIIDMSPYAIKIKECYEKYLKNYKSMDYLSLQYNLNCFKKELKEIK